MGRHRAEPGEMTVGSLFTGYDGLGLAVEAVLGAKPLWFSENAPAPSKVLAYRWPDIPNLGDMTSINWSDVPRVDIITGGFPCTDLSLAGRQEGMHAGTRSGLWAEMARAIDILRPQLIIAENVRGLLSGKAHSSVEQCPGCLDGAKSGHIRALGVVLSDLARIGYDAQWHGIRASEVGAPHQRYRVFVVAHLRNTDSGDRNRRRAAGLPWQAGPAAGFPAPAESAAGGVAAAAEPGRLHGDAGRLPVDGGPRDGSTPDEPQRHPATAAVAGAPAADTGSAGPEGPVGQGASAGLGQGPDAGGRQPAGRGEQAAADATSHGRGEGLAESAGELGRHDAAGSGVPVVAAADPDGHELRDEPLAIAGSGDQAEPGRADPEAAADPGLGGLEVDPEQHVEPADAVRGALGTDADGRPGAEVHWGQYAVAVERWELITGRTAPAPTMTGPRGGQVLAPPFVEWMMGLDAGHVTDPAIGLSRSQQLSVLGNGVVPQQAAAALRLLLPLADEAAA